MILSIQRRGGKDGAAACRGSHRVVAAGILPATTHAAVAVGILPTVSRASRPAVGPRIGTKLECSDAGPGGEMPLSTAGETPAATRAAVAALDILQLPRAVTEALSSGAHCVEQGKEEIGHRHAFLELDVPAGMQCAAAPARQQDGKIVVVVGVTV